LIYLKILILASLFLSFQGCAQNPEQPGDSDCAKYERALADGREEDCRRAKEPCLASLDRKIKEDTEQMRTLLTALGADTERENVLRSAIAKLEKDLAEIKMKRERLNAAQCNRPQG